MFTSSASSSWVSRSCSVSTRCSASWLHSRSTIAVTVAGLLSVRNSPR
ncbi:ATP-dependent DNA helicase domain protein [Mycobacterium xenopi 4042]|uniref:ATP-dependent DNA helicase domain protein n=1 Tax=Mycobacterium xenopi 4042 TaxID=1299334 RepID=X7YL79_MYCXE|nr:ATP-dependent DNA helicase domain protein [Mycobacterium xenopi 4042]